MDGSHPDDAVRQHFLGPRWMAAQRRRQTALPQRKVAKMPPALWRPAAIGVTVLGALIGFAIWESLGGAAGIALLFFVVGMYLIESMWLTTLPPELRGSAMQSDRPESD